MVVPDRIQAHGSPALANIAYNQFMTEEQTIALQKAACLLKNQRHAAMATVNDDGSPHNTPFFFMHNSDFTQIYMGTHPEAQHSQNLRRTGKAFIVIYDSKERKQGGLYIQASRGRELSGGELAQALTIHNATQDAKTIDYYTTGPQRMYGLTPTAAWVHMRENDSEGMRVKDYRHPITLKDLAGLL